ncbi:hypothetical protein TNCV_3404891 [Trichonephila clavipes]|nr:hypothetical protein TNCV_3404891 [Trichonephila clavipes]
MASLKCNNFMGLQGAQKAFYRQSNQFQTSGQQPGISSKAGIQQRGLRSIAILHYAHYDIGRQWIFSLLLTLLL